MACSQSYTIVARVMILGLLSIGSVQCQLDLNCTEGDIQLVDGSNQYEGRVEICHNNVWGTVCDDAFDSRDSAVVCRQLGFAYAGTSTLTLAYFGVGIGQIWLDNLACTGSEARLVDCGHNPFGSHNCGHSEDVGTRCIPDFYCITGDIRLVGGANELEGRVEVCFNGTWGTVCDDSWTFQDANVVCRQLGFSSTGAQARGRAAFGQGVGDIVLDNVVCDGNELRLFDCASNPLATHNCLHSEDAGVVCQPALSPCTQGDIRLVAGARDSEGRVEVCNQNQWGSVCDVGWDLNDGNVACRQAGFGSGTGRIWMSGLTCGMTQLSLFNCTSTTPIGSVETSTSCRHADDASVRCQGLATACTPVEQGNIRLANGSTPYGGRVEVCYNGQWGTVCDDGWGGNDAGVACRQLGFSPWASTAVDRAGYGQGTGLPILLDDLACSLAESRLIDCRGRQGSHNCVHGEDAGVICVPSYTPGPAVICVTGDVRLVGGSNPLEGRLEVCYYNQWGTICSSNMTPQVAQVACRQLGYAGSTTPLFANTTFGQGDGPIVANVACNGTEVQLMDCLFNITHNCVHEYDMALRCTATSTGCTNGAIRLAGTGSSSTQGRVEVCNNNQWGTVCEDTWNSLDASVACFHLGYSKEGATGQRSARYGQGTGPILLDQVHCNGNESSIFDCPQNSIGQHDCFHFEDAGITCSTVCQDGDLRLVGGRYPAEGRLEFCYGGVWGTVCHDRWGEEDAQVACRQLGFLDFDTAAVTLNATAAGFGVATGPVMIDETNCNGNETSLISCRHSGIGTHNCPHSNDVGLRCVIASVQITDMDSATGSPTLGQSYSVACVVTEVDGPITPAIYQWMKDGIAVDYTGPTLSFSPFRLTDTGQYTCQVTVNGMTFSGTKDIRLPIPSPASVSTTSNPLSPVDGMSTVTVTCTVELNSTILVASDLSLLIVEAQLSRPNGTLLSPSNAMVSGTIFTYITQLNSFGRDDSGNYTCTATVRPQLMSTYFTGIGMLADTVKITVGVAVKVNFQFISNEDSMDINFSLACNSIGGPANSVVWTRDGFLLDNTGPLELINASTFSYTNVIMVSSRTPGTYTCQIREQNDQVLSSANFSVQAAAPPVNVQATQSSSSAPVEVSWSLPSDGAINITGYRVFYSSGRSVLVPSYVNSIVLNFVESSLSLIKSVFIRSESMQLPSELISATVAVVDEQPSSDQVLCTCSSEVGIAVGVLILIEGFIAAIIVVICWLIMRWRKSGKNDLPVSVNMAYGEVNLGAEGEGEYEDPDKLTRSDRRQLQRKYVPMEYPSAYEFPVSKPVYATADEIGHRWKDTKH